MVGVALPIEFIELSPRFGRTIALWVLNRFSLTGCGHIFYDISYGYIHHRNCGLNGTLTERCSCPAKSYHERLEPPEA